ncbi:MAG: ABC transporter substrate-binding protein [Chloroflexi bacterium]|nr:ABC transporter substrate-binding protein [Chloroflexota bacterium]
MHPRWLAIAVVSLFVVGTACAPAAAPSPTAAPAKPAATTAPAQPAPTAAPAKPAATAAPAKPAATAAPAKPAEKPATKPEDIKIPKPSGNLNLKIGHPSSISFYDVPTQVTHERLKKDGWTIESVQFTRTDLNTQALSQGTVQISISQILDPLRVFEKGGKVSWLMEHNGGEFVMIAKNEIKTCKDMDGTKFAIHGDTATTSVASRDWLLNQCKVKPNILVIPGGENRIVALANNQIDGTQVQLADWINLDAKAPGKFHVIDTGGLYNISGAGLWANNEWLEKNQDVGIAYIAETLKTFRMIHANPKIIEDAVLKYVPDTPKDAVAPSVKAYLDIVKAWPQNGGDTAMLEDTIKFFTPLGELQPGMDAKKLINTRVLEEALKLVGKVPGAR